MHLIFEYLFKKKNYLRMLNAMEASDNKDGIMEYIYIYN